MSKRLQSFWHKKDPTNQLMWVWYSLPFVIIALVLRLLSRAPYDLFSFLEHIILLNTIPGAVGLWALLRAIKTRKNISKKKL